MGDLASGSSQTCTYSVLTDATTFSEIFEDDMEDGDDLWTSISEEGFIWELNAPSSRSGDEAWFAQNIDERLGPF